jgi:hypothetical protein
MVKKLIALILTPTTAAYLSGCSLAASSTQPISIMPSHPNAEVYVDGTLKGVGPQTVLLSKKNTHSVMAKCGGSSGVVTIDRNLSTTGILDIIGGFLILVPFVGLLAPGAWELSPTSVSVPIPDTSGCSKPSAS